MNFALNAARIRLARPSNKKKWQWKSLTVKFDGQIFSHAHSHAWDGPSSELIGDGAIEIVSPEKKSDKPNVPFQFAFKTAYGVWHVQASGNVLLFFKELVGRGLEAGKITIQLKDQRINSVIEGVAEVLVTAKGLKENVRELSTEITQLAQGFAMVWTKIEGDLQEIKQEIKQSHLALETKMSTLVQEVGDQVEDASNKSSQEHKALELQVQGLDAKMEESMSKQVQIASDTQQRIGHIETTFTWKEVELQKQRKLEQDNRRKEQEESRKEHAENAEARRTLVAKVDHLEEERRKDQEKAAEARRIQDAKLDQLVEERRIQDGKLDLLVLLSGKKVPGPRQPLSEINAISMSSLGLND